MLKRLSVVGGLHKEEETVFNCIGFTLQKTTHLADDRQLLLDKVMDWLWSNVLPSRSYDQILLSTDDSMEALIVDRHQVTRPG